MPVHTHTDLVEIALKWVLRKTHCGTAFKELHTACSNGEYPDVIGFGAWGNSVLIEVKVSRKDFQRDRLKMFRIYPEQGMGMYRFYICPTDIIRVEELPDNWGLIYVNEKGRCKCVHNPYNPKGGNIWNNGFKQNLIAEHGLMYSALRRLQKKGLIENIYNDKAVIK